MKGTILYGPRDVRFEERDEPKILQPTDAILRLAAIDAIVFTHGSDGAGKAGSESVDYGGVRNILTALGSRKVRIALMTSRSTLITVLLDCADKLVRGVARAPNRAIASGTHRLRPPTTG